MIVTINSIRDGVISTLSRHFPDADVYGERIAEDLKPPAFFVKLLDADQTQELGIRYLRSHMFDIHYFAPEKSNEEYHDMAELLYDIMDLIEIDGAMYHGTGMKHQIIDEVLHFFVDYNFPVKRVIPEPPKMREMEQEGFIREQK